MTNPRGWRTLRTFAAVAEESAAPASNAGWVSVGADAQRVEVRLVPNGATTGGPTSAVVALWRRTVDVDGNYVVDRVGTATYAVSANVATPGVPAVVGDFGGSDLYATVYFVAGTNPTFSGTLQCRALTP